MAWLSLALLAVLGICTPSLVYCTAPGLVAVSTDVKSPSWLPSHLFKYCRSIYRSYSFCASANTFLLLWMGRGTRTFWMYCCFYGLAPLWLIGLKMFSFSTVDDYCFLSVNGGLRLCRLFSGIGGDGDRLPCVPSGLWMTCSSFFLFMYTSWSILSTQIGDTLLCWPFGLSSDILLFL